MEIARAIPRLVALVLLLLTGWPRLCDADDETGLAIRSRQTIYSFDNQTPPVHNEFHADMDYSYVENMRVS